MHASSNYHPVGISPLAVGSVRTRTASPMTQLTSLKNISQQSRRNDDPYAVDKETIKAVLNKGLSHESLFSDISTDGSTTSSITTNYGDTSTLRNDKPKGHPSHADIKSDTAKTPAKVKQMQRQKSRRSLMNGGGGQRPDLGTVGSASAKPLSNNNNTNSHSKSSHSTKHTQKIDSFDDGSSVESVAPQQSYTQSFVGSISSLFFGRKGGLL